jgi:hypothetical protein
MITIINIFLILLGVYFLMGLLFGLYFIYKGATKIDPLMEITKKKVRFLVLPGVIATWPLLIGKFFKSKTV